MSTKTTFKRIALVAVAALGLGVLTSVAPASAARVTAEATPCWVSTAPFGVLADAETATATAVSNSGCRISKLH
jgi:trimeric autotransporter adhesin